MIHSHQPSLPISPSSSRSGSPISSIDPDSTHNDYSHNILNIHLEGWLNKCNVSSSSLASFASSNHPSFSTANWRLVKALLKDGTLTLFKPPSEISIKSFDFSVQNQVNTTTTNNNTNTTTTTTTSKRLFSSKYPPPPPAPISLSYRGTDPHPDLEYERLRIVGGSDEAICHTILFGNGPSFAKTSVLLLPLLTDIVIALDILTAYTSLGISEINQFNISHSNTLFNESSSSPSTPTPISTRLKLIVETMQNNFPGMLLDSTIFAALLKLVDAVSLHDYQISTELKKSVFMKQKHMSEILSYSPKSISPPTWAPHQQLSIPDKLAEKISLILLSIDTHNTSSSESSSSSSSSSSSLSYGNQNFFLNFPPDLLLSLSVDLLAKQIYHFHLLFSKNWSPTSDISLLFNTPYSYNKHSPLVFDSTNIHFLGSLLIDHLFNTNQKIDNPYRGRILTYWINLGNALKNCGDMVGWLSIATVICSIPVLRLRSVWCYVAPDIRDRVTKEWAPVVFDLERRLMISDMSRKSTFHVLAPQGIGLTYPKERVVPFFGDLCVKFEHGSSYKQCESRLNRIRTAFERWQSYLLQIPQNDTFDPLPDPIPVLQRLLYTLLSHHYQAPVIPPESILKLSLVIEPNYLGQYLKFHYSQKSALSTGAFSPLLFTTIVPAFRLIPKSLLLSFISSPNFSSNLSTINSNSSSSTTSTSSSKRTLRSSSSRSGDSFKNQQIRLHRPLPPTLLTTGILEIDSPLRSFMASVSTGSPLLQDVFDILNVGTRVFHLGNDIILKDFDENTKRLLASHEPFLVDSAKGISLVARHASNQIASHDPTALGLSYGSPDASPRHSGTNVNTVVKAANLERLVDILILGVSDFSSYIHDDDLAKYPEIHPTSNQDSSTTTTLSTPIHPVFRVDMDVHTMTFFATYRSFCSATLLLESFRKRFVGAQSAALSIARHLKSCLVSQDQTSSSSSSSSTGDSTHFPNWDPTCDADPESIDWRIVAQIQIGVLEACHLWVSQYFSDFSNDLAARDQFLDLLRNFEVELQTWKDAGVLLRDDYKYYYDTIEALHKRVRKLFIKKSYRPIDIKKLLPAFPIGHQIEWIPLNGDIAKLERFIDDLDTVAAEYFNNVSMRDWMEVFEILEAQGSEITGFFNYKLPSNNNSSTTNNTNNNNNNNNTNSSSSSSSSNNNNDDDPILLDIYSYLESFKNGHNEQRILATFPHPVRELFKFRNNIISFFVLQISDSRFKRDERVGYMVSILKMLGILRQRMSSMDVFYSETNPAFLNEDVKTAAPDTSEPRLAVSPHIPSFIESAIAAAVVRPESRYFANSWLQAAKETSKSFHTPFSGEAFSVEAVVPDIPANLLSCGRNGRPNLLTPCIGWLFERLFEIVLYLPNMAVDNSKLINFDKHRYTYNIISSILDIRLCLQSMESRFQISLGETPAAAEYFNRLSYLVNPKKDLFRMERRLAHQTAARELKEFYHRSAAKNRVFYTYVLAETDKHKRDTRQRDLLERQTREARKQGRLGKSDASLTPDRKSGKSRFGGFLKAVRPISMAFSGSFTPPSEKVVHPDDLPQIAQLNVARFKQLVAIKLVDAEVAQLRAAGRERTFFRVAHKGAEYWFQAPGERLAEEWVRSLDMSRKYANLVAVMSPSSAKVFGVPVRIVCEREGTPLPRVVEMLLSEIEERGLQEVGIYRIPGSLASVNALKAAFDSGEEVNMKDDRWYDVNTVTGCFKLYLRELPEPLLTADLLGDFVACGPIANTDEGIARLRRCVQRLPPPNYNLLERLVAHLHSVTLHGDSNKMHAVNLAIVFSMSLLPSSSSTALMNTELGSMQTILKTMITTHDRIFGDAEPPVPRTRLTAEGRSKRFSSLILPSEFVMPEEESKEAGSVLSGLSELGEEDEEEEEEEEEEEKQKEEEKVNEKVEI